MKTRILYLLIVLILGALWNFIPRSDLKSLSSKNGMSKTVELISTKVMKSPQEIIANDYEKIAKNLSSENTSNDEWKNINNYAKTPQSLVNHQNAKKYFNTAQSNIPDLFSCLKKDFCGMETRGEGDAYFDDQKTPAHILLKRNLSIIKESLQRDSSLKSKVNWDILREIANSGHDILSVEALDIIRKFDRESVKMDELIKAAKGLKGQAKADVLTNLLNGSNSEEKSLLLDEVEDIFAMGDANTVISLLEKLKYIKLGEKTAYILKNVCRFKENEQSHNWPIIKTVANKIDKKFESTCN